MESNFRHLEALTVAIRLFLPIFKMTLELNGLLKRASVQGHPEYLLSLPQNRNRKGARGDTGHSGQALT